MPASATDTPAISVVMPLFNRAQCVGASIESVLGSDFGSFELIIVDDGSSDDSAEVVRVCRDPRVRLIELGTNQGANAARNRGIAESRAGLISFLDSDDLYMPHRLSAAVCFFAERPQVDGVIDGCMRRRAGRADKLRTNPALDDNADVLSALFDRRILKATPGISVRREAAIRAGQFDEGLRQRQDYDFLLRLLKVGRVVSRPEPSWIKVTSADAITPNLGNALASMFALWDRHPDHFATPSRTNGVIDDLGRHFAKLATARRFGLVARDLRSVVRRFGWPILAQLPIGGATYAKRIVSAPSRYRRQLR